MNEYLNAVYLYLQNNINLRYGQALFNVLLDKDPELAERIRGTELDPFHWNVPDKRLDTFLGYIEDKI